MKAVKVVQDESSHWYIIPNELAEEFHSLLDTIYADANDHAYLDEEIFEKKFSEYRTGGDINNIQLYIDEKN